MKLQPGKQTFTTYILPKLSRNKDSETMEFGQ